MIRVGIVKMYCNWLNSTKWTGCVPYYIGNINLPVSNYKNLLELELVSSKFTLDGNINYINI